MRLFIHEKLGYLADVTTNITITEGETIDLGNKILIEGDVDRSGIIDLETDQHFEGTNPYFYIRCHFFKIF